MSDGPVLSDALRERLAKLSPERRALLQRQLERLPDNKGGREIARRPVGAGPAPLSYSQELLWRLAESMPDLLAYNVPRVLRISGPLDTPALRSALDGIVERHEILRTRFVDTNEGLRQIVDLPAEAPFEFVDLSDLAGEAACAERDRVLVDRTRYQFDLTCDRQLRATLLRIARDEHVLLLLSHHIVSDEWSREVVFRELDALYSARAENRPSDLPELGIQYSDYAAWQRDAIERGSLVDHLAFWRHYLRGLPPLELPTDRPPGPVPDFSGARRRYTVGKSTLEGLQQVGREHDATLFMTLLAAYQVVLSRYSGQVDFAVGTPITTRRQLELEALVGYFPNVLVLRAPLDGDPTFAELIQRVRRACLDAYEHQDVPLEKLTLETREGAYAPLFQTWFVLLAGGGGTIQIGDLTAEAVPIDFRTAKFDIAMVIAEVADGLQVTLEYRTALFDAGTIDRFFSHFESILVNAAERPTTAISMLPLMGPVEQAQVLAASRGNTVAYPAEETLLDLLEAQATRSPAAIAVEIEGDTLSYELLHTRAAALARWLTAQGIGRASLVGVCLERSTDLMVALLAVLKSGAAYVPLDPEYPSDRLAFMLEDAAVRVLLTQSHLIPSLPPYAGATLAVDRMADDTSPSTPSSMSRATPDDPAYMIYTSGSTGQPKGALNSHRGITNRLRWMQGEYRLAASDAVLQKTPASFDVSVWEFFWPLISGARLVMARPGGHRDANYLADVIAERRVSVVHFVPSMLAAFLEEPRLAERCASLRDVVCSGEALPGELARRFFEAIPQARLHNLYGPTEAAVDVSYHECERNDPRTIVPIGRPVANTQLYVLDARRDPVPAGIPGELYIAGAQVGLGYHNRADLTADRFVPDSISSAPNARMYRTGDRARWLSSGILDFMGRMDLQVKLRGQRVELGEIEAALAAHPAVHHAIAMVHHDDEGEQRLVAYVVPRQGEADGAEEDGARDKWRTIFDDTYTKAEGTPSTAEIGFNIAGWISSYDQQPIPAEEMRDWIDTTCEQINALHPKRVLEIGCGTGLVLFRVAPRCESYLGVDISAAGLRAIKADPALRALKGVSLRQAEAHELDDLPAGSFDTIILNSVVQYFPNIEYLLGVLDTSLRLLAPGGSIFLGDIRSFRQLEAFHVSVTLANADPETPLAEVRGRVEQALAQESELIVDPEFFATLGSRLPRLSSCVTRIKSAHGSNELVRFRYDVLLRADAELDQVLAATPGDAIVGLDQVRHALLASPDALRLNDLPNGRVRRDVRAAALLYGTTGVVRRLNAALDADPAATGIDPADLLSLSPEYTVEIVTASSGSPDRFDASFRRKGATASAAPHSGQRETRVPRSVQEFVHHPARTTFAGAQVQSWRDHLERTLPDFMVPSMFVRLDEVPLTPSGKADRRALHPPAFTRVHHGLAPRTEVERGIAAVWSEVLRVPNVGVEDSFLDLGGHSLLAMRIIGRLRRDFGVAISLAALLRGATVADLAREIDTARASTVATSDEPELAPVARDSYRRGASARDSR